MTDAAPRLGWYVAFDAQGKAVPAGRGEALGGWWWLPSAPSHKNVETLPPGWTLGPRIDDLLRDAARYRWLRDRGANGDAEEVEAMIDAEIARERGDG